MIEASHKILINNRIDCVWDYACDMASWASIFPGCKEFIQVDDDNSEWIIKVGVGGLVRTVNVLVHVDEWHGPERVDFSYRLKAEPVVGRGSYTAEAKGADETEITLSVGIQGSGQMALMWESMCRPVIPLLIKSFAEDFKVEVEKTAGVPSTEPECQATLIDRIFTWLRSFWSSTSHDSRSR